MLKNKVKISEILRNQLPEFVRETYPLVSEFLTEYYRSQEIPGGPLDLLNNIEQYVKLDNITNIIEDTVLYKVDDPNYYVDIFDDIIYVKSVSGFAERYGLIQINNEIITYEYADKENNAFVGCVRGFSGIEEIENEKQLVFVSTLSDQHLGTTLVNGNLVPTAVKNLNILFLKQFLVKSKKQFAPGFDNREFYSDDFVRLNQNVFIKHSSDFYSSKGTDNSFKILFKALYGDEISIIKPRNFVIEPSNAQYRVTRDLVVESISGNPLDLVNRTLFQDSSSLYSQSYGSVTNVEKITRDNKDYYIVSLDYDFDKDINVFGSIFGSFPIHPKTICTDFIDQDATTITVDSTVGFPNSGELIIDFEDGEQVIVTYESKSLNQFYDCSFILRDIPLGTEVKLNTNAFSFLNREQTEKVIVRITGVLSKSTIEDENNQLYEVGDTARIRFYGDEDNSTLFNNWIYNIPVTYKILPDDLISQGFLNGYRYEIITQDENNIYNNESVEVDFLLKDLDGSNIRIKKIFEARIGSIPKKSIQIVNDREIVRVYNLRKLITKVKGFDFTANIQNTYKDKSGDLYVASPSLPNYFNEDLVIRDRSVTFNGYFSTPEQFNPNQQNSGDSSGELIIFRTQSGNLKRHGFITGDAVVYIPSFNNSLEIQGVGQNTKNVYFVKKIDNNSIKLSLSKENLYNNIFLKISGDLSGDENRFVLYNFCDENLDQKFLGTQKLIRKIEKPTNSSEKVETKYGTLGIFANGVEILNYKSEDVIYSGKINNIKVAYGGQNYDVINPPTLEVEDPKEQLNSKVTALVSVEGSLKEIQVIDGGFGYIEEPKITITGGGGSGALAKANLVSFDHYLQFNSTLNQDIKTSTNSIETRIDHRFYNGEKVLYDSNGQSNVGSLLNGQYYYVSVVNSKELKLHQTYDDAINNVNEKSLTNSLGVHFIRSIVQKKKIESILVLNSGSGYKNNQKNILPSDVIIESNTIISKNHNYNSGDVIKYTNNTGIIGGLENQKSYYVTKINDDQFKLSQINSDPNDLDFFYRTNQYIEFTSVGEGIHVFNYPPIIVTVEGKKEVFVTSDQTFDAIIRPIFRGSITAISIINNGFGYGSEEIINFNKQPSYRLISGDNARLKPLIVNGRIKSILIENSGSNYNSIPDIRIRGKGLGCKLIPILNQNGTISEVKILNEGVNYGDDTTIDVINSGSGAELIFEIQSWTINLVNRLIFNNQISSDDSILSRPLFDQNDLQYTHAYSPRKLREYVYTQKVEQDQIRYRKDLDNDNLTTNFYHSPIIGWSYDGCPIYGPYGYDSSSAGSGGKVVQMRSGYNGYDDDFIEAKPNRPSTSIFPLGFFVEDYDFIGNGHLDEFNGRFCKTPEFPEGTYAYFLTLSEEISNTSGFTGSKKPIFPYVIGNYFKFKPIEFNFKSSSNQDLIKIEDQNWDRNTFVYNINSEYSDYDFIYNPNKAKNQLTNITSVKSGSIDNIRVAISGTDYSVGDPIIFDEESKGSLYAEVSSIEGKDVLKIESNAFSISNVEFLASPNSNQVIVFSPYPHNILNNDRIFIKNLNKPISLSDSYNAVKIENRLVLLTGVEDASVTGIITHFNVFGDLNFPKIKENDVYTINNDEKIKILQVDKKNSRIKVQREYENTNSNSYQESTLLFEEPRKLTFTVPYDFKINSVLNDEFYFEPEKSVILTDPGSIQPNGTLFLSVDAINIQVGILTGTKTTLTFNNVSDILYFNSGYVDIVNSTDSIFNATRKKITSIASSSITIDYDTTSYNGVGVTAYLNKWKTIEMPSNSIYLQNHNLNTGDNLIYNVNSGVGCTVFNGRDTFVLEDQTELYVAKFSNDLIGISTNKIGLSTEGTFIGIGTTISLLYFSTYGEGNNHSLRTRRSDTLIGNIISNKSTVYTKVPHGLSVNDKVSITCAPENEVVVPVEFDESTKRLLVDRKNILPENVNIFTDTITITNHGYFNGQKVLYKTANDTIGGLVNGEIYYVNVVDFNTIRLSSSYYNATLSNPITINLTSVPSEEGFLHKVNPELNFVRNNKIIFDLSSPSLSFFNGIDDGSIFDFKLFLDDKFLYEYLGDVTDRNTFEVFKTGVIGISTDARMELDIKNVPYDTLYYKLVPTIGSNVVIYDDIENINYPNKINFINSSFNGNYSIVGISTNAEFSISLEKSPEFTEYFNNVNYVTTSKSAVGPIDNVSITLNGSSLKKLPTIEGIASETGSSAVLYPESNDIGKISSYKIVDIGFNYPIDNTISPKFKFPSILKIEPLSSIEKIDLLYVGDNYTLAPQLILIDSFTNEVVDDVILQYDLDNRKVLILQNTKGIYNISPKIIPVNNSNGLSIKSLEYDSITQTIKATLNAYYPSLDVYPFRIGDRVFIEGVRTISNGSGYNSSDHDYELFTVTKIENLFGGLVTTVEYDFSGYGDPGAFDPECTSGSIVLEKHFPIFSVKLTKNNFLVGETVVTDSKETGIVETWDASNELLKVETPNDFNIDQFIRGIISGSIGRISKSVFCKGSYTISSSSIVEKGWNNEKGFLNSQFQKIHDSDYYQYFSYSIKSNIEINKWNDEVSTLNHTAGFKKFSDLNVQSIQKNVGISTEQNLMVSDRIIDIVESVNLNCVNDFDLVFENSYNIDNNLSSDQIYFNSKELQDYSESRGNRVLLIDDISSLFTSIEREEKYSTIDKFTQQESNLKKYIFLIEDKLRVFDKQLSVVTLLNGGTSSYLNQYAKIWTNEELGSFDSETVSGISELNFYPVKYEFEDYNIISLNYGFDKEFNISQSVSFGDVANFFGNEKVIVGTSSTTLFEVDDDNRVVKILNELEDPQTGTINYNEITLINDGNSIYTLEYGNLSNSEVGLGTYNSYLSNGVIKVDFIPNSNLNGVKSRSSVISISNSNYSGIGTEFLITSTVNAQAASIESSSSPVLNNVAFYSSENVGSYYIISIEDTTNDRYQVSEILLVDDGNECYFVEYGILYTNNILGSFSAERLDDGAYLKFEPLPNIDVEIRILQSTLRLPNRFITSPSLIV